MRRTIMPLIVAGALLAPTAAHATGTGHSGPAPAPPQKCACCGDLSQRIDQLNLVFDQRITVLEQKVAELQNTVVNLTNYIDAVNLNVTVVTNRVQALSCQSDRVYEFRARREVDGSPVTGIASRQPDGTGGMEVEGRPMTQATGDDRGSWHMNGDGRLVITADYSGIEAPRGQVRTVVSWLLTADGERHRTKQALRLCLEDDGNMNDRTTQGRADD